MAVTEVDAILRLLVAAGLTGILGIERELRGHDACLRTYTVVGVGAALFTLGGALVATGANADVTRIAAQVVSGIGFIGGGLIFRQGARTRNLTTAAGVWAAAAIGVAIGLRFFLLASAATLLILIALSVFRVIEHEMLRRPGDLLEQDADEHEAARGVPER